VLAQGPLHGGPRPHGDPAAVHEERPSELCEREREHVRSLAGTPEFKRSLRERRKVEMRFAHLTRNLGLRRLRLRGPTRASDEFLLTATAQNLRRLARTLVATPPEGALAPG
jgi:hypothetical protein